MNSVGEEDRHTHQRFCHSTVRGEVHGVIPGALEHRAEPSRGHAGFLRAGGVIEAEGESE